MGPLNYYVRTQGEVNGIGRGEQRAAVGGGFARSKCPDFKRFQKRIIAALT